jgi:hypothetical protein
MDGRMLVSALLSFSCFSRHSGVMMHCLFCLFRNSPSTKDGLIARRFKEDIPKQSILQSFVDYILQRLAFSVQLS